jgi:adenylate cyclase
LSGISHAVFISYASQDAEAARRICDALRAAGIEVWFDQSELRGGDVWDRQIRQQIHDCRLFIPIISANTEARVEGYFRREWKLAVDRTHDLSERVAFLVPIVIDSTSEAQADVPDAFRHVQWTRLPGENASSAFVERIRRLITPVPSSALPTATAPAGYRTGQISTTNGPHRVARVALWALSGVVALGLAYFVADRFWLSKHRSAEKPVAAVAAAPTPAMPAIPEKSVAVLPFVDMSEKKDQEYLADGMAEEIINLLARAPDLHVPARTSSFYFKGKSTKVPDIARELSVSHILEGSVRRSGSRLRVTAQLIRADNGYHLWSDTYDRDVRDVFQVQDDIANAVVQALQITLMGGPLTRQRGGTKNLEAYQLYLRGLDAEWENTRSSLTAGRDYFDQAIHRDSRFGLAWGELARDTVLMTNNGMILGSVGYELSRQQAKHALQLSPDLAEAHAMLGYISRVQDFDWAASEAELHRALELDPTNPTALMFAAQLSRALGRFDEAERQVRTALARDPLFTIAIYTLGTIQYNTRRFQEAEATFRRLLALAPNFLWTRTYLAKALLAEGQVDAALAVVLQERDELNRLRLLPTLLQAVNRKSEADDALMTLITRFGDTEAYFVAMNYAFRGEKDRALEWLERAHDEKATELAQLVGERLFDNLASDPRYKAFLRKMNLPES